MKNDLMLSNFFREFFNDKNVHFPTHPKLLEGISVYDAPNGLGVQFRGGPEKLILKGKTSSKIWNSLNKKMNGSNSFQELLQIGLDNNINIVDLCNFFKIIHSYHLFESSQKDNTIVNTNLYMANIQSQLNYYDRLVGYYAQNNNGSELLSKINKTKILIITNLELLSLINLNFRLAGYKDLGFFYIDPKNKINIEDIEDNNLTFENITNLDNVELRDILFKKINDYHYVVSIMENPSNVFLKNITNFCFNNEKPLLTLNLNSTSYEVGPLFYPKVNACYNCYILRNQSFGKNNHHEYLYQKSLNDNNKNYDENILGVDIPSLNIIINMAISELIKTGTYFSNSSMNNKVITLNTLTSNIKNNDVLPVFGCPCCSKD